MQREHFGHALQLGCICPKGWSASRAWLDSALIQVMRSPKHTPQCSEGDLRRSKAYEMRPLPSCPWSGYIQLVRRGKGKRTSRGPLGKPPSIRALCTHMCSGPRAHISVSRHSCLQPRNWRFNSAGMTFRSLIGKRSWPVLWTTTLSDSDPLLMDKMQLSAQVAYRLYASPSKVLQRIFKKTMSFIGHHHWNHKFYLVFIAASLFKCSTVSWGSSRANSVYIRSSSLRPARRKKPRWIHYG